MLWIPVNLHLSWLQYMHLDRFLSCFVLEFNINWFALTSYLLYIFFLKYDTF